MSKGKIATESLVLLLKPFLECVAQWKPSGQIVNYINANVFCGLARQLKLHIKQNALESDAEDEVTRVFSPKGEDFALESA